MGDHTEKRLTVALGAISALCKHIKLIDETLDVIIDSHRSDLEILDKLKEANSELIDLVAKKFPDIGVSKLKNSEAPPGAGGRGVGSDLKGPKIKAEQVNALQTLISIRADVAQEIENRNDDIEPILYECIDKLKDASKREAEDIMIQYSFRLGDILNLSLNEAQILLRAMVESNR